MSSQLQTQHISGSSYVFQAQNHLEPQYQINQITMAPLAGQPASMPAIFNQQIGQPIQIFYPNQTSQSYMGGST